MIACFGKRKKPTTMGRAKSAITQVIKGLCGMAQAHLNLKCLTINFAAVTHLDH